MTMETMNVQFCVHINAGVYGWMAESKSYMVFGDSKREAIDNFKKFYELETGIMWTGRMTARDTPSGIRGGAQ